jgi:hypothetical protein
VAYTKFAEGAWLVVVAIPLLVLVMYGIRRHYVRLARRLRAGASAVVAAPPAHNTTLLLVESLDDATDAAFRFANEISEDVRPIHVPTRHTDPGIRPRWFTRHGSPLRAVDAASGVTDAVLEQVWQLPRGESDFVTVVVPEYFERPKLVEQARHPHELALKLRLLEEPGVVVTDVPVVRGCAPAPPGQRIVARVLVSGVNAASMRAVNYASTLDLDDVRAVHFAVDAESADELRAEWLRHGPRIPLEVHEAPYRDIGVPLLDYLRPLTDDAQVLVLLPELVTRGWRRLLHNQRALYIKRLLLFEPNVVLASVPYQLLR